MIRPANCTDEVLAVLDELGKDYSPNVHAYGFGTLQRKFSMTMDESYECVRYWQSLRAGKAKRRAAG